MVDLSLAEVTHLISAANAARWQSDISGQAHAPAAMDAERRIEALFRISHTLAVYGTLAPGRSNHHMVAPLGGDWTDGFVEGDHSHVGWGTTLGYPAFRPRVGGLIVAVHVLTSPSLAAAWPTLDDFEGPEYRRILVPVFRPGPAGEQRLYTVANLYAAAEGATLTP
jgi:gamma-glutamylcyclotransferase (GGCT)/AIG2-like uncharacterized protein YtfP